MLPSNHDPPLKYYMSPPRVNKSLRWEEDLTKEMQLVNSPTSVDRAYIIEDNITTNTGSE